MGRSVRVAGRARQRHAAFPPALSANPRGDPVAHAGARHQAAVDPLAGVAAPRGARLGGVRLRAAAGRGLSRRPGRLGHVHLLRSPRGARAATGEPRAGHRRAARARAGAGCAAGAARPVDGRERDPALRDGTLSRRRPDRGGLAPAHPARHAGAGPRPPRVLGRARSTGALPDALRLSAGGTRGPLRARPDRRHGGDAAGRRPRDPRSSRAQGRGLGRGSGLPDDPGSAPRRRRACARGARGRSGPRRDGRLPNGTQGARGVRDAVEPLPARGRALDVATARVAGVGARDRRLDRRGRFRQRVPLRGEAAGVAAGTGRR